ncbi:trascription factor [Colletotrichum kahawae]|uniref:Trascription factor n=1 Tax=Colletotrichum kahawae TaxID=34407 RepID=A0AAE0D5F7_COLKA|nr:trascription factor [Colletotrichum kahawae]
MDAFRIAFRSEPETSDMQRPGRKRVVSSCIPCYTRKQKVCAIVVIHAIIALGAGDPKIQTEARQIEDVSKAHDTGIQQNCSSGSVQSSTDHVSTIDVADSIAEVFGYFEDSESNTMAVVCGYYVMEIHWMEQLVHPPWFLAQYQVWWNSDRPSSVFDVEFAVLLLRICISVPMLTTPTPLKSSQNVWFQARLASFWRGFLPRREYDATVAEATYERFCNEFLTTLPPAFALESSTQWDERLPMLPLQRQNLHTTIFESLCCNFRPVLLQNPACLDRLPVYKRVLLFSQRRALAVAALRVLESVSKLHTILGGCHTRFVGIIFPTFEAAVLLVGLCMDSDFPGKSEDGPLTTLSIDPLGLGKAHVSREQCLRAVDDALARLRMLAEVSNMAEVAAQTLTQLLSKMPRPQTPDMESIPAWINQMLELGVEEDGGQCDSKEISNSESVSWLQQVSEELT